jgi:hypothetical protein
MYGWNLSIASKPYRHPAVAPARPDIGRILPEKGEGGRFLTGKGAAFAPHLPGEPQPPLNFR